MGRGGKTEYGHICSNLNLHKMHMRKKDEHVPKCQLKLSACFHRSKHRAHIFYFSIYFSYSTMHTYCINKRREIKPNFELLSVAILDHHHLLSVEDL